MAENVEHPRQELPGDPDPIVLHFNDELIRRRLDREPDRSAGFGVLDRVVEQVDDDLRWGVQNETAFEHSLEAVMAWEFDRVITGHRDVPETNKAALGQALREAGFLSARNG